MQNKKERKKQEAADFNAFIQVLKSKGFDFDVTDGSRIKNHCGKGLYRKMEEVLLQAKPKESLIFVFRENDPQFCWLSKSKIYSGSIIINLAHFPGDTALAEISKIIGAVIS